MTATTYRIRETNRRGQIPAYLKTLLPNYYDWTAHAAKAARFVGRQSAIVAAKSLAEMVGSRGYPGVRFEAVPTTGGAPIGETFVS
jgi:hypothetical protein